MLHAMLVARERIGEAQLAALQVGDDRFQLLEAILERWRVGRCVSWFLLGHVRRFLLIAVHRSDTARRGTLREARDDVLSRS